MFALILLVVTSISTALAPPPPRPGSPPPSPAEDSPSPAAESRAVARTVDASRASPTTVEVAVGDVLDLTVSADEAGAVELRDLGQIKAIDPTTDATFNVIATEPGRYPIVLLGSERTLGTVRVTPREG